MGAPTDRILLLSAAVFLLGSPFAAYVGLAPRIQAQWGLSPTASAGLYSAFLFGAAMAAIVVLPRTPPGSPAAVRLAAALAATGHIATSFAPGPFGAAVARAVAGGAYIVVYYGAVQWLAAVSPAAYRGRVGGALVTAGYGGTSASYLAVAAVLELRLGWRTGYLLLSLPTALGAGAVWLALRGASPRPTRNEASSRTRPSWRQVVGPRLRRVIVGYAVHTAELYVARFWIPYALVAAVAPTADSATGAGAYVLSGLLFAAGAPSPFLGGWIGDRLGTGRAAGSVLAGGVVLATALLFSAHQPGWFVVLCLPTA